MNNVCSSTNTHEKFLELLDCVRMSAVSRHRYKPTTKPTANENQDTRQHISDIRHQTSRHRPRLSKSSPRL